MLRGEIERERPRGDKAKNEQERGRRTKTNLTIWHFENGKIGFYGNHHGVVKYW